jgi:crossover junction endodeoxyribonuclease RuvC
MKSSNLRICGIDPGLTGAFAFVENGEIVDIVDMPTIKVVAGKKKRSVVDSEEIVKIFKKYFFTNTIVYLEKAHAMPGQGVVSMFTNGETFGKLTQACFDFGFVPNIIRATDWKKEFNLQSGKKIEKSEKKIKTFELAVKTFKKEELFCKTHNRKGEVKIKILDGRSDAAIIAYYGYIKNK